MDSGLIGLCFALITLANRLLDFLIEKWKAAHTAVKSAAGLAS
jgi:hypothetical protein